MKKITLKLVVFSVTVRNSNIFLNTNFLKALYFSVVYPCV